MAKAKQLTSGGSDSNLPEDDVEMTFFEHLGELRKRLIRALAGVLPGMIVAWFFKEDLLDALLKPMVDAWMELDLGPPTLHFANPIDPFVAYLKIAIVVGAIASSPWFFWQVWAFISPGLYRRERRMAIPFALVSTIFFVGGTAFGYFVVFPLGFQVFLDFAGFLPSQAIQVTPTIMINEYLTFSTRLLLAFGIVFEVPVVITFIAAAGLVTWQQLARFFRWWALISAVLAAILTPPDVASQLLMLGPLLVLYILSIGIAFLFQRRRKDGAVDDEGVEYER